MELRELRSFAFDQAIRVCAAYHFTPKIAQEANEFLTVLALVASGAGVALVPHSAMQEITGVVYREVKHPSAEWSVGALWRRDESDPVIRNFMDCLKMELAMDSGASVPRRRGRTAPA